METKPKVQVIRELKEELEQVKKRNLILEEQLYDAKIMPQSAVTEKEFDYNRLNEILKTVCGVNFDDVTLKSVAKYYQEGIDEDSRGSIRQ